ncbi:hypothetical protein HHI36_008939 [Cryptolaemus montrouzieri]|uniref:Uncharacterized protein n=1 Tax=Cryptolaemus montrouzieri TaxID=559131 RepID=A0ABD2MU96_9CUCU
MLSGTFGVEDFIKTQQSEISTESFTEKRLASDILRRILSEVTKLVSNESLNVEQVIPKISSTDFVNHVLSSEISTIQEQTKILNSESVIKEEQYKEGIHKMDQIEFHSPITRELKIFDSNNPNSSESRFSNHVTSTVNLNILDSEEVLVIKEKQSLESSFHSLMKDSSIFEISGSPSVPRELLPILEKQKAVSGARFVSQQSNSRFKDEFKMFKSKVKNLMSSLSLVKKIEEKTDDNYRSGDHFQTQNKLPFMKMRNMLPPRTVENMNQTKSNMSNIITLKSKIRSFVSSDSVESSDNLYNVDETEMRSASLRKSKMPEIVTFLARNTLTSSESLCDDILSDRKDKENPDIIMLSKPHDIFSSGSLTSENLGIDDSIYYLAETDSEKKLPINKITIIALEFRNFFCICL